jgi:riboflavin kinase/FMN adenylyltransferase
MKLGQVNHFTVHEYAHKLILGDTPISSSRIRHGLAAGNIEDVTMCLGRPFRLTGTVVLGDRRGHTIGFPTANMDIWDQILVPGHGVYATTVYVGHQRYAAATNIGVRPTVDGQNLRIEPHLLDFNGDLYGQQITLEFIARIRPEKKFENLEALKAQIALDVAQVRGIVL